MHRTLESLSRIAEPEGYLHLLEQSERRGHYRFPRRLLLRGSVSKPVLNFATQDPAAGRRETEYAYMSNRGPIWSSGLGNWCAVPAELPVAIGLMDHVKNRRPGAPGSPS